MKILAKPMSSPSRTDKFPRPLMRFLRSNVGSKSRGKSRSSPMFMRKKNCTIIAGWSHEEAYGQRIEVKWHEERKCTNFQNRKELQFDIFEAYLPVFSLL
ncbi:hypothetical protein LOK49_LG05G00667 [Camellia lanceoleosa]|uniref:Uncharacterized protein n=1 Tax=Camellia lanceoleosa TaxID=1840588 RepID=A0ACC0HLW5_9ERIC|nr:hypothetical protein LOK49_LG05G00667 [Camellia lanceoleosa]